MRRMINEFEGVKFYESTFDERTGLLVRQTEFVPPSAHRYSTPDLEEHLSRLKYPGKHREQWDARRAFRDRWEKKYGWGRKSSFSPTPESIDISITDWCNFGCAYCYQDSTATKLHAPKKLVETVLKGFRVPPYQIAIGGGEPTAHPDFPEILYRARELGTVPNYTTAGHILRDDVIEATNAVCGGVSLTYHAHKGWEWFTEHYCRLKNRLDPRVELNIHVIADKDVAETLAKLRTLEPLIGKVRVILLAYYPDVGRGQIRRIMPKRVYNETLPEELKRCIDSGMRIAFSEGLLPYFFSRPEIGIDTRFATRMEGHFSCYVDPRGRMSTSSFDPPRTPEPNDLVQLDKKMRREQLEWRRKHDKTVYDTKAEWIWNKLQTWRGSPRGNSCDGCVYSDRCATPNIHHYLACAFSEVNSDKGPPLLPIVQKTQEVERLRHSLYEQTVEFEKANGRQMTREELDVLYAPYFDAEKTLRRYADED